MPTPPATVLVIGDCDFTPYRRELADKLGCNNMNDVRYVRLTLNELERIHDEYLDNKKTSPRMKARIDRFLQSDKQTALKDVRIVLISSDDYDELRGLTSAERFPVGVEALTTDFDLTFSGRQFKQFYILRKGLCPGNDYLDGRLPEIPRLVNGE